MIYIYAPNVNKYNLLDVDQITITKTKIKTISKTTDKTLHLTLIKYCN